MEKCTFDKGDICYALTKKKCENCKFYKTKEQFLANRKKYGNKRRYEKWMS